MSLDTNKLEKLAAKKFPLDKKVRGLQKKPITKALEAAGLSRCYWSRWKRGLNSPNTATLEKLMSVLK